MSLPELLGLNMGLRPALALGLALSLVAALVTMPPVMRKLRGANITGKDRHKPQEPEVPEMGGLGVFLAFNVGVFGTLAIWNPPAEAQLLVMAGLIVAAGACITGVLDDLLSLRQRFKAFIPLAFAAPLALYAPDWSVAVPLAGVVDFGLAYPLLLVPFAVTCASNGFNMLEGLNGMTTGFGIILAAGVAALAILAGNHLGLLLLFPLLGALGGFLYYNAYPSKVFSGDTMTLLVGAVIAAGAILSKVEFWGFLLFVPHTIEFFLKARSGFKAQCFATRIEGGVLHYEGPLRSWTHLMMSRWPGSEPAVVARLWGFGLLYAAAVVGLFVLTGGARVL